MQKLCDLSALMLRNLIVNKDISPLELLESCIERIRTVDGPLNAFITDNYKMAKEEARRAEKAVLDGDDLGILHGIPVGIKDLEATAGIRTTFGSLLFSKNIPKKDQGSVANVRAAGGIILGKTNTPEFGAGGNTRNLVFGATKNPFDISKTCGGSSGGSAVALSAGMVPLASGSDYGGSLRTPASFCGVVGIRPSPGIVAAENRPIGLLPFSVLGPMGRTVNDAYILLQAQAGTNLHDPFSMRFQESYFQPIKDIDLGSIRAMFTPNLGSAVVSKKYNEIFNKRSNHFRKYFGIALDGSPNFTNGDNCFEVLRAVNFVAAHGARVDRYRNNLSPNVIDNVDRGREYSIDDIAKAHLQQTQIARDWLDLFNEIDVVICPAASVTPFPHEEWSVTEIDGQKMDTYMKWLAITYLPTMALACGVTLPCGTDHNGMPYGIQVLGAPGNDVEVISIAKKLENFLSEHQETMRPTPNLKNLEK